MHGVAKRRAKQHSVDFDLGGREGRALKQSVAAAPGKLAGGRVEDEGPVLALPERQVHPIPAHLAWGFSF